MLPRERGRPLRALESDRGTSVPVSRANSPGWGVSTSGALRFAYSSVNGETANSPSASSTTGLSRKS